VNQFITGESQNKEAMNRIGLQHTYKERNRLFLHNMDGKVKKKKEVNFHVN
jgi:hypothetical protein